MYLDRLNPLLPLGLVEWRRNAGVFYRAGLSRWKAALEALYPQRVWEMQWASLGLYPPQFLRSLEYWIDVGANDGSWSNVLYRYTSPKKFLVIEPTPELFEQVKMKFHQDAKAKLECCAIASASGHAEFQVTEHNHNSSLLRAVGTHRGFGVKKTISVPTRRLDDLTSEFPRVDLLKIDTQGTELDVLEGARQTLSKTRAVFTEANFQHQYEGGSTFSKVDAWLTQNGFELFNLTAPHHDDHRAVWADALYFSKTDK